MTKIEVPHNPSPFLPHCNLTAILGKEDLVALFYRLTDSSAHLERWGLGSGGQQVAKSGQSWPWSCRSDVPGHCMRSGEGGSPPKAP